MLKASKRVLAATRRQPQLQGWLQLASILLPLALLRAVCEYGKISLLSKNCMDVWFRNCAPVAGGERELRSIYLPPFKKACLESLAIMTAYSSYDGVPAAGNSRESDDVSGPTIRVVN